ncbi:hypothetical protein QE152_g3986 [Popillia japonica]|uniref:Uncharacterized protein n=1 Tax=Popillia japonica TaxID=7064 RepID=A0AAW1N2H1_POPJA
MFNVVTKELISAKILIPYSNKLPLILATVASPKGIGAVILSNKLPLILATVASPKGIGAVILHITITSLTEKLRPLYGTGRNSSHTLPALLTLITDNQPLRRIFHPNKGLPSTPTIRLPHYASYMYVFNYENKHRKPTIRLPHYASYMYVFNYENKHRKTQLHRNAYLIQRKVTIM